ncbi:hypothetical protein TNIN_146531 [Trichonephila inaurata madagascariensis]|uniref:Uncharacterized protein n=1 Tax=Trichonephila inaurata madagascariensis TaxID=2747483 RepID=A0A8X7BRN2_9ARAC|nr:hypothetical protein TNIN_146531 [Trichonephila inaurata madagascariensis]
MKQSKKLGSIRFSLHGSRSPLLFILLIAPQLNRRCFLLYFKYSNRRIDTVRHLRIAHNKQFHLTVRNSYKSG